ncbi:unnamed protein product [Clonostachys rosea]|uniref:Aminoglycoside phosphotransferase domain-containing protein n=1 Tax=Bionectria ochroleuca TaxID=29856 RepID=A0ABY6TUN0_BIOOC|nr:unnamed protein product [Clonostachys rosea]
MHYFSLANWIEHDQDPIRMLTSIGYEDVKNRSAYKWDSGLWTACWESREVVMKAFDMSNREGRRGLKSMIERYEHMYELEWWQYDRLPLLQQIPPRHVGSDATYEPFNLMIRPFRDACCFDIDIKNLHSWKEWEEAIEYFSSEFIDVFHPIPYVIRHEGPNNFVFEFDPSWNIDFPTSHIDLMGEFSPRAFIAHLVDELVQSFRGAPYIWLLDRCDRRDEELPEPSSRKSSQVGSTIAPKMAAKQPLHL